LASLVILEAPAPEVLQDRGKHQHYRAFRQTTDAYFADFAGGKFPSGEGRLSACGVRMVMLAWNWS
jgi:hypothetical protein